MEHDGHIVIEREVKMTNGNMTGGDGLKVHYV